MSHFWSPLVETLSPYTPGEQPRIDGLIKLNTNENPYPPSPRVSEAIAKSNNDSLRLYPDPSAILLKQAIAQRYQLDPAEVFVGNGSDEVLAHIFCALFKHDAPLLFPDVTYSFYPVYCNLYGIRYEQVPLDSSMQVRIIDYNRRCGAIILPNPNAPTGTALNRHEIETLVKSHPEAVVVIDEAYVDFGAESAVPLIAFYDNLLVVQTLSKSRSLAGLRVGYAMGNPALIEALVRVKDSFNSYPLGHLAIAGAVAAIEDEVWFEETRQKIISSRSRLMAGLKSLGFEVLPSLANFIFVRHPDYSGVDVATYLRKHAIIVRHFPAVRIKKFLRITVGTDLECDRLLTVLGQLIPV